MATTAQVTRNGAARVTRTHDLGSLSRLDPDALRRLYGEAVAPPRLDPLAGQPRGRMLAVRGTGRGPVARAIRALAGASAFPWGGKTFMGSGESGTGVNRIHLFGRHQVFPFHTRIVPSVLDGAPCVALDYDLPDNPALIRSIHDEVREVAPGLFFGPAMWKTAKGPRLVLWFALDTHDQAAPFGQKGRG